MPRSAIASSMNRPSASSPTTPENATRSPSRAAPHAKIADELPTVIRIESTTRSTSPKMGTGSGSATMMSGLISPTTRMSMSRSGAVTLSSLDTTTRPASSRSAAGPAGRARDDRHRRPARRAAGAGRVRPSPGSASLATGSSVAASAHTERPTRTPLDPASQAVSDLRLERPLVDPARQQDPGHRGHRIELGAGVRPARPVRHRRVIRELGLEDVAADRGQPARGLDDDAPAGLAGQGLALDERERERLHEQRDVGGTAVSRDIGDEAFLVRRRSQPRGGSRRGAWRPTPRSASPARRSSRRGPG